VSIDVGIREGGCRWTHVVDGTVSDEWSVFYNCGCRYQSPVVFRMDFLLDCLYLCTLAVVISLRFTCKMYYH